MGGKFFPREHNCYDCSKPIRNKQVKSLVLKKPDGNFGDKLLLCGDCYNIRKGVKDADQD